MNIVIYKGQLSGDLSQLQAELVLRQEDALHVATNSHREHLRREIGRLTRMVRYLEHYRELVDRLNEMPIIEGVK